MVTWKCQAERDRLEKIMKKRSLIAGAMIAGGAGALLTLGATSADAATYCRNPSNGVVYTYSYGNTYCPPGHSINNTYGSTGTYGGTQKKYCRDRNGGLHVTTIYGTCPIPTEQKKSNPWLPWLGGGSILGTAGYSFIRWY